MPCLLGTVVACHVLSQEVGKPLLCRRRPLDPALASQDDGIISGVLEDFVELLSGGSLVLSAGFRSQLDLGGGGVKCGILEGARQSGWHSSKSEDYKQKISMVGALDRVP